jgi:prophage regulatory protein
MAKKLIPYCDLKPKGVPYSKPHLWRLEGAGKFPKSVPIGPGRYGSVQSEIDGYIAACAYAYGITANSKTAYAPNRPSPCYLCGGVSRTR